jgi:hypothetical protein
VLSGVGMGVASPSIAASIANVVDQDALGTASAMQRRSRAFRSLRPSRSPCSGDPRRSCSGPSTSRSSWEDPWRS